MQRNPPWSRDELILAMDPYVRRGWLDDRHPEVIKLSQLLNRLAQSAPTHTFRNTNGVSMKLANFRAIDPNHPGLGLRGAGRNDRGVWEEFAHSPEQLALAAAAIRVRILDGDEERPAVSDELADAEAMLSELAGHPSAGQGLMLSVEGRRAIEAHAIALAKSHFVGLGWDVEDVSAHAPYDLLCRRPGAEELHVEVKGTQSQGRQVLLTRNEVAHARRTFPSTALFILARIELFRDDVGAIAARGGSAEVVQPWELDESALSPLAYEYRVGRAES